jgi:NTP pyrophosphatase (non-canonical NTP hydrolase)
MRLLKLTEEVGEVADAFIGMHGLNGRKGVCRTRDDLLAELADAVSQPMDLRSSWRTVPV